MKGYTKIYEYADINGVVGNMNIILELGASETFSNHIKNFGKSSIMLKICVIENIFAIEIMFVQLRGGS